MNRRLALFLSLMVLALIGAVSAAPAPAASPAVPEAGPNIGVEEFFDRIQCNTYDSQALVRFLPDNVPAWYARWAIMDNARSSIDTTYFIVEQDIFGHSMLGMLLKKAREGVKIRIMLDARGTKTLTRTFFGQDVMQELSKFPNVTIKTFNPVSANLLQAFADIRNIMASNHDKILLVDDEYVITGGRNISKNYFVDPRDLPTVYRDTDVLIKSKVVAKQTKQAFDEEFAQHSNFKFSGDLFGNWKDMHRELDLAYHCMRRYLLGQGLYRVDPAKFSKDLVAIVEKYNKELSQYKHLPGYAAFRLFEGQRPMAARLLDKHSKKGFRNDITWNLISFFNTARSEILIQNPYVVLTPEMEAAIKRANRRGVKIVIQTNSPMSTDSLLTQAMFIGDWKKILADNPGLRIFGYKLTNKLHSKVFVFDRKVAVIGTYNMDYISEQVNSEQVAVIKSPAFATQVAKKIEQDIANSHEYKVKVEPDGTIKTVFGPETHSDPKVMSRLQMLLKLGWLRPLI
ncbi:MAG: phospholipase D-family protein [Candidatus Ozemobacter sibiricus]|jgi:phosphatidylserine/phosphatidylglycerophosphate/cardiolipin synthase-like enzyme|uniref:Phospholipase D-family protein n=1 Tax=Candidatus Ozemobacter sibiricus TaxID=2268124 RepID=A0A367ZP04_9BACT|nr:MAG: phospholipase D-family protein [Candidatus Ozemobacter sibiricus]